MIFVPFLESAGAWIILQKEENKDKEIFKNSELDCLAFLKLECRKVHTKENKLPDNLMSELWTKSFKLGKLA